MAYFDKSTLLISNRTVSDEGDINNFATAVEVSFDAAEVDIVALQAAQNQAVLWAREDVGVIITENIGGSTVQDYSARAYATEAKLWAQQTEDTLVVGADGVNVSGGYSALHYSAKSASSASASSSSASASATSAQESEDWAEAAVGTGTPGTLNASSKSWAITARDTEVTSGNYSALHWADVAKDWAEAIKDGAPEVSSASAKMWAEGAVGVEVITGSGEYSAKHWAQAAIGNNTLAAGTNVTIDQGGTGPYIFTINSPNSVQNTRQVIAGTGLTGGGALSSDVTLNHEDTSSQASVNNSSGVVIQDVTLDTYGHVTGLASVDTATLFVPLARTVTAGSGLTGGGALSSNITLSHQDTSSQASVNNSGYTFIQDVTLDTYGHVTGLASATVTLVGLGGMPLSGGTFTGGVIFSSSATFNSTVSVAAALNVTGFDVTFTNSDILLVSGVNSNIIFSNTDTSVVRRYLDDTSIGDLLWRSGDASKDYLNIGALANWDEVRIVGGDFRLYSSGFNVASNSDIYNSIEASNETVNLGYSTTRWKKLWTIDIDTTNAVVVSSDKDLKKNITYLKREDADWLYSFAPVTFRWKDKDDGIHYGFIAQEVKEKLKDKDAFFVKDRQNLKDKKGADVTTPMGLAPTELIAPMLQLIKDQKAKIDELEARIEALEA